MKGWPPVPPRNSATDQWGKRTYTWDGRVYPSVTTLLRSVAKPALVPWAAGMVADRAVDHAGLLPSMLEAEGRDATRRWLAAAPTEKKQAAADLGTHVHQIVDMLANDLPLPPLPDGLTLADVEPFIAQWHNFVSAYEPEFVLTEVTVYSRKHDYAGTFDSIARIGDELFLCDVKTGRDVYPEVSMQLAAYGNAEFMDLQGLEVSLWPTLPIEWGHGLHYAVLHLRPDSFRLIEIDADWPAFLAARDLARFLDRKDWQRAIVLPQLQEQQA